MTRHSERCCHAHTRHYLCLAASLGLLIMLGWYVALTVLQARQQERDQALMAAVRRRDAHSILRLLDAGADPNAQPQYVAWVTIGQHGASVIGPDTFWTRLAKWLHLSLVPSTKRVLASEDAPLHVTAVTWDTATARLLLDRGARVDIRDWSGNTPLMRALRAAVFKTHTDGAVEPSRLTAARGALRSYIALLLARGATPNATCSDRATPLSLAVRLPDAVIVELLGRAGASRMAPSSP